MDFWINFLDGIVAKVRLKVEQTASLIEYLKKGATHTSFNPNLNLDSN
jgi:hypothetical protein